MSRWSATDLARVSVKLQEAMRHPMRDVPLRGRRGKYGNERTVVDGITFGSKLEARRYGELKLLEKAGEITHLEIHWPYYLHAHGVKLGYYEADFSYRENGELVIEDTKGVATSLYKWKKRHIFAEYGVKIREIKSTR